MIVAIVGLLVGAAMGIMLMCIVIVGDDKGKTWTCELVNAADTGTCELVNAADDLGDGTSSCMCDMCGYTALDDWWNEFNFCPNCGRRVVDQ